MEGRRTPAGGDTLKRLSLASLGRRKHGGAVGSQGEGGGRETTPSGKKAIVRHVPIVVEGDESDCDQKRNVKSHKLPLAISSRQGWIVSDCSSSSSLTSQNSLEELSQLDRIEEVVRAWMMRNAEKREEGMGMNENQEERCWDSKLTKAMATNTKSNWKRKPFSDISQNKDSSNQRTVSSKTSSQDTKPLRKSNMSINETNTRNRFGQKLEQKQGKTDIKTWDLKAPSLILVNSEGMKDKNLSSNVSTVQSRRSKHTTNVSVTTKENKVTDKSEMKTFTRGPGQGSFRGTTSSTKYFAHTADKTETVNHKTMSNSSEKFTANMPRECLSEKQKQEVLRKNENNSENQQSIRMRKSSSQNDLRAQTLFRNKSLSLRKTPSVSTSSIPSEVEIRKPPCVGILKTPGKRKISSNRVEFLNNVREREIPGRHV